MIPEGKINERQKLEIPINLSIDREHNCKKLFFFLSNYKRSCVICHNKFPIQVRGWCVMNMYGSFAINNEET